MTPSEGETRAEERAESAKDKDSTGHQRPQGQPVLTDPAINTAYVARRQPSRTAATIDQRRAVYRNLRNCGMRGTAVGREGQTRPGADLVSSDQPATRRVGRGSCPVPFRARTPRPPAGPSTVAACGETANFILVAITAIALSAVSAATAGDAKKVLLWIVITGGVYYVLVSGSGDLPLDRRTRRGDPRGRRDPLTGARVHSRAVADAQRAGWSGCGCLTARARSSPLSLSVRRSMGSSSSTGSGSGRHASA
jgi:hypothetical protein